MITLKHKNKKYKIPNQLKELTIKDYQYIIKLDRKSNRKFIIDFLGYFGVDDVIANKMASANIIQIMNSTNVMLNTTNVPLTKTFSIDGITYGMDKLTNLRFDQFADLTELTDTEELINDNLHIILAIIYRPIVKKKFSFRNLLKRKSNIYIDEYDSKSVIERSEIFKEKLNMEITLGLIFFFSHLKMKLFQNSLASSVNEKS